jgi:hypothetical protein
MCVLCSEETSIMNKDYLQKWTVLNKSKDKAIPITGHGGL